MNCRITINMDNAAFEDSPASELTRIFRDLADRVAGGELPLIVLQDANGNTVGQFEIETDATES